MCVRNGCLTRLWPGAATKRLAAPGLNKEPACFTPAVPRSRDTRSARRGRHLHLCRSVLGARSNRRRTPASVPRQGCQNFVHGTVEGAENVHPMLRRLIAEREGRPGYFKVHDLTVEQATQCSSVPQSAGVDTGRWDVLADGAEQFSDQPSGVQLASSLEPPDRKMRGNSRAACVHWGKHRPKGG